MEYKCLENNIKLYYYPEFNKKLVIYIDHPYYVILFLIMETYLTDFEIEYNFKKYFTLILNNEHKTDEIINIISIALTTILDYYILDFEIYSDILTYIDKTKYYNLVEFMFPNYNFSLNYKNISYDNLKKSIKYFFKNSQIHFITNSKSIFNSYNFESIIYFEKKSVYFNNYTLPYKKFSFKKNKDLLIGIYLDKLEYYDHYILDILKKILKKKNIICELIWISKKYKIMILSHINMNVLKKTLIDIYRNNFEININNYELIKKKSILDIINFKHYDLNLYQQITKKDIINLSQKIFNQDNIKFMGPN